MSDSKNQKQVVLNAIISATQLPTQCYVGPAKPQQKYFDTIRDKTISDDLAVTKPSGGLWTSPLRETGNTYSEYVSDILSEKSESWELQFSSQATVLYVDESSILQSLPTKEVEEFVDSVIQFETVFDIYDIDGIYMTQQIIDQFDHYSDTPSLYLWDVESGIWNTTEMIQSVTNHGKVK